MHNKTAGTNEVPRTPQDPLTLVPQTKRKITVEALQTAFAPIPPSVQQNSSLVESADTRSPFAQSLSISSRRASKRMSPIIQLDPNVAGSRSVCGAGPVAKCVKQVPKPGSVQMFSPSGPRNRSTLAIRCNNSRPRLHRRNARCQKTADDCSEGGCGKSLSNG